MDKDFIRLFYQSFYENPQKDATKDSVKYDEKRIARYEKEKILIELLKNLGDEILQAFENYLDACADEQDVLLEEIYLMGAEDRERMLN